MSTLLAEALLLLSFLWLWPAPLQDWLQRLSLHALLLAACLLAGLFETPGRPGPALIGMLAALAEAGLLLWLSRRHQAEASAVVPLPAVPLLARMALGLALVAIGLAVLPERLPPHPALAIALAMMLLGLLSALLGRPALASAAALVPAGHGLILLACHLPGPGWPALCSILPLQAWLLWTVARAWLASADRLA